MNLTQFKQMGLDGQLLAVMNRGILLLETNRYNLIIRLFQLKEFYVEVISNKDSHEVIMITTHPSVDDIEHLLEVIDIFEAMN